METQIFTGMFLSRVSMQSAILIWHFCPSVCLSTAGRTNRQTLTIFYFFFESNRCSTFQGEPRDIKWLDTSVQFKRL